MNREGSIVLYGTQTGTAEDLAVELQEEIQEQGGACSCENDFDFDFSRLERLKTVFIIISTWGDGDPPDDAEDFCEKLDAIKADSLIGLEFSVFALGDSGYELFCECGKKVDQQLEKAGSTRLLKRVDCDIDIDGPFTRWKEKVLSITRRNPLIV